MLLPKLPSIDLLNAYHHGIPHSIVSDEGSHFTAMGYVAMGRVHRLHSSYSVPHHTEAAALVEW